MSYDVSMNCTHCGSILLDRNHTSNTACMWRAAGCDLAEFHGKTAAELAPVLEAKVHTLKGEPHVVDIRNVGLAAGIDLAPIEGQPGLRAIRVFERALDEGFLVRFGGATLAVAPPFISSAAEVETMVEGLRRALRAVPV